MTKFLSHRFLKCTRTHLKLLSRCPRPGTLSSLATKQMIKHHDTALRPTRLFENGLQTRNLRLLRFTSVAAPPTLPFQCFRLKLVPSQLKTYTTRYFDVHGNVVKGWSSLAEFEVTGMSAIHLCFYSATSPC